FPANMGHHHQEAAAGARAESNRRKRQPEMDTEEQDEEDAEQDPRSDSEIEEQLCAQAMEALNHFTRSFHNRTSQEIARNRLKSALYRSKQRRTRLEYPIVANAVFHDAMQSFQVAQTSELPGSPDRRVKSAVKVQLHNPRETVTLAKRGVLLSRVPPLPTATMWTALSKNYEVEDEPQLKFLPYFGDDDDDDVISEFYQIKCVLSYRKRDKQHVSNTVLVEVHKQLRQSHRAAKKKRRMEAMAARNGQGGASATNETREREADGSMDGQLEDTELQPNGSDISQQNNAAQNAKAKELMMSTGRNCGNQCFLGQMSSASSNGFSKARAITATFGWDQHTRVVCARTYFLCSGNFCEMAKILGDKTCLEVAQLCDYYDINDHNLTKENCFCVHDECKIFFQGCQCQRGRCRTKACPCFCAGRECDLDLCQVCCSDEIAARQKGEAYDPAKLRPGKDEKQQPVSCQNRGIALRRQKHLRLGRSNVGAAGWGLFVDEFIAKDEFIVEYIGEMVSQEEAERRGGVYDKIDCSYLFNLDTKTVIDSTRKGNKTRLFFDYRYDKQLVHAELIKEPTVTDWM
ncbi:hypothetical protein BBJ28_00023992, partial [Nothophytophthora sp. Chile5]